jgi:hypothetical protein
MPFSAVLHLSYRSVRRADDRVVTKLLQLAELPATTPLGLQVETLLRQRMGECRDLFVQRGVKHPQRMTVLRLAGRSIAADAACAAQLPTPSQAHSKMLLRAICVLIERVGESGFPAISKPAVQPAIAPAKASETPIVARASKLAVTAPRRTRREMNHGARPALAATRPAA